MLFSCLESLSAILTYLSIFIVIIHNILLYRLIKIRVNSSSQIINEDAVNRNDDQTIYYSKVKIKIIIIIFDKLK